MKSFFSAAFFFSSVFAGATPFPGIEKSVSEAVENLSAENCAESLSVQTALLNGVNYRAISRAELGAEGERLVNGFWSSRLAFRKKLRAFHESGEYSAECASAAREFVNAVRYAEDLAGEAYLRPAPFNKKKPLRPLTDKKLWLLKAPGMGELKLESGDVLISRGMFSNSAAIARIGDQAGQFSHAAIVYIDEATGAVKTVESHIEVGAGVFTLAEYAADNKVRVAVYRHPNRELAHLAAKKIHDVVSKAALEKNVIPYDFSMDTSDRTKLFCTEVVDYGFEMAAKELGVETRFPLFKTGINPKNREFVYRIGVRGNSVFAPSDMDVDAQFEQLAEWRDFSQTEMVRKHDAIFSGAFAWMDDYDYRFTSSSVTEFMKNLGWNLRRTPVFSGLLKDKLPLNMSKDVLEAVVQMYFYWTLTQRRLEATEHKLLQKGGVGYSAAELRTVLDNLRARDLKIYKKHLLWERENWHRQGLDKEPEPETPVFHEYFRPRD